MRLNHNLASLNICNQLMKNEKQQSIVMNRVSSGVKVARSAEGPYVLGQSETLRMQIRGLQMAQRNVQDGVSMLQVVDGGLDSATDMLHKIKELIIQAGGSIEPTGKAIIQNEIKQMTAAIDNVMNTTEFNGVKLLNDSSVISNNSPGNILMASGSNAEEIINIPKFNLTTGLLGDEATARFLNAIDVTAPSGISDGLDIVEASLKTVLSVRTQYGALESRFEGQYNNIGDVSDNLQKAESGIRDTDVANEIVEISKYGILTEAANALLVQTNRFPMDALKILENVRR